MKISYKIFATGLAMMAFAACEKEIDLKVPPYEKKLVINSSTMHGDTIMVRVSNSESIKDYKATKDLSVTDATAVLFTGNGPDTLRYNPLEGVYYSHTIAEAGKKYNIQVSAKGYETATAEISAVTDVRISSVQRIQKARLDIDGNEQDEIRLKFTDPPQAGDFYIARFTYHYQPNDSFYYQGCAYSADASIETIYGEGLDQYTCLPMNNIFFRDELFNGASKDLRIYVPHIFMQSQIYGADTLYPTIELQHVSEAYFRYTKSYQYAQENNGNPFSEPVNVYTNIKNGYGIFNISGSDVAEIK